MPKLKMNKKNRELEIEVPCFLFFSTHFDSETHCLIVCRHIPSTLSVSVTQITQKKILRVFEAEPWPESYISYTQPYSHCIIMC